jgi:alpha-D-ribose 1-methylphosphonate 5-triphosphate synthase subunit PhnI
MPEMGQAVRIIDWCGYVKGHTFSAEIRIGESEHSINFQHDRTFQVRKGTLSPLNLEISV